MKRTVLTLIVILTCITSFAQNRPISDQELKGKHFKSPDTDKFVGTWSFNNNGVIFSITLNIKKVAINDSFFMDFIEGTYTITENGSVTRSTESNGREAIRNGVIAKSDSSKNTLAFRIVDSKSKARGRGWLKLSGKNALSWKIEKEERAVVIVDGKESVPDRNFTIPTNAILTRQK